MRMRVQGLGLQSHRLADNQLHDLHGPAKDPVDTSKLPSPVPAFIQGGGLGRRRRAGCRPSAKISRGSQQLEVRDQSRRGAAGELLGPQSLGCRPSLGIAQQLADRLMDLLGVVTSAEREVAVHRHPGGQLSQCRDRVRPGWWS